MPLYFEGRDPRYLIYCGKDKHENEELIRWGWPEDVWFHVADMSSAHVYVRLLPEQTIDDLPAEVIEDAAQLCKLNSIQGCKVNNVKIVITMWENLKKVEAAPTGTAPLAALTEPTPLPRTRSGPSADCLHGCGPGVLPQPEGGAPRDGGASKQ